MQDMLALIILLLPNRYERDDQGMTLQALTLRDVAS